LGACLATGEAAKGMVVGTHGTTYGGNPMAMAVGRTVLGKLTAPGFLEGVQETAGKLRRAAEDVAARHPAVFSGVRGRGLMLGLVTRDGIDPAAMISDLLKAGLVTGAARTNVIRMVPPLVISDAEIAKAVEILDQVAGRARAAA
jgi:acetylornithine/N-succinyldiaminopimelate aminotransferase